jgi:hypothetical protein
MESFPYTTNSSFPDSTNSTLNSSLTLVADPRSGLKVTQFISNGTDVLASPLPSFSNPEIALRPWHAQVVPTLLYRNQTALKGELWRGLTVIDRLSEKDGVWDDFCITDVDQATYAQVPLNEMVFWSDDDGKIAEVELPAFRVTLKRTNRDTSDMMTGEGADTHVIVQT